MECERRVSRGRQKRALATHNKEEVDGATGNGLGAGSLKVLLLANVGHEGGDVVTLLNEPSEDARGVWEGFVSGV